MSAPSPASDSDHPKRALLASLMALVLFCLAFPSVTDAYRAYLLDAMSTSERLANSASNRANFAFALALFGIPTLWWHLVDLAVPTPDVRRSFRRLLAYPTFLVVLMLGLAGMLLVVSGLTEKIQCQNAGRIYNDGYGNEWATLCDPTTGFGIEWLVFMPALALVFLCVGKTAALVIAKLKPDQ